LGQSRSLWADIMRPTRSRVATTYVSPLQYQNYDCDQLGAESERLTSRVQQLGAAWTLASWLKNAARIRSGRQLSKTVGLRQIYLSKCG
jgi:hypothetical protein